VSTRGSDGDGEFGERCGESVVFGSVGGDLVVSASQVLNERVSGRDDPCGAMSFESAHRAEPGFESSVITFDRVVRVLLDCVHR
jgi:hypothetical protein